MFLQEKVGGQGWLGRWVGHVGGACGWVGSECTLCPVVVSPFSEVAPAEWVGGAAASWVRWGRTRALLLPAGALPAVDGQPGGRE